MIKMYLKFLKILPNQKKFLSDMSVGPTDFSGTAEYLPLVLLNKSRSHTHF